MSLLWSEVKLAVRVLMKAPGFSLPALFALALGIGPNTAIFSIVSATLLEPLPYPRPDWLVMGSVDDGRQPKRTSPAEYFDWKEQSTSFQYLEAWWGTHSFNLASQEAPVRVNARQTSPDGHRMFGEPVWLGRDFRANEDQPGENRVVLMTHQVWREHFGADPDIIGRDVRLDGVLYTVIGVLQPGSRDRQPADLWIPLTLTPEEIANRDFRSLLVTTEAGRHH
ncbi:MAG: ABC transporter permease [Vicinamibacteraceae bacterium]